MKTVRMASDGEGFVRGRSGEPFRPLGFNYDHGPNGQLLEDYWHEDWDRVVNDFKQMKRLGANVVRIHLQFGRFMKGPAKPNQAALDQLQKLLDLAERTGLYLDITGLGCYHKEDVPKWYHNMDETQRWRAQANFWRAVAKQCADSPAVFCYDLMNEPVVPGGKKPQDNWLGPAFADTNKHFVQFITRNAKGRPRPQIARQWIATQTRAIRAVDDKHLITVGLVPWSLDKPGLTSGFVPEKVAPKLDFLAVHLYPQQEKLDQAMETLKAFAAAGKPVLVEETFPLKCSPETLLRFMERADPHVVGWISFFWGTTPEQYSQKDTMRAAIAGQWLRRFSKKISR
jgi:endo-1,4-beta-mannosidase